MNKAPAGWEIIDKQLSKTYKFPDFVTALAFVKRVGAIAEEAVHHPDIELSFGKVVVKTTTHDAGGLTEKDYDLAARIDA
jgi:4a-hydroxytetrahydrobiopterin dehydratase